MSYNLGYKVLRRLCEEQDVLAWYKAKLNNKLFKGSESPAFEWIANHVAEHHVLPQFDTFVGNFPEVKEVVCPEPTSYYVSQIEHRYFYETIDKANIESQGILKSDQTASVKAMTVMQQAINEIKEQQYRAKILDLPKEGPDLLALAYQQATNVDDEDIAEFGWKHMDDQGPVMPGDIVSFVGRPAMGKTWQMLYSAMHNWKKNRPVLFVSMEMAPIHIAQRVASMYGHTNFGQLKTGTYSNIGKNNTFAKFKKGLIALGQEKGKFYVVDGNLAASAEDVFALADQLKCTTVYVDGAYLLRHKNGKLDRFLRAAENVELMKRYSSELEAKTFASWQFNREASKKAKKSGEVAGLEDIGYTDAIGQISSIVLGLFQDENIETMKARQIRVLKGRNGETGQFSINWDFNIMDFDECPKADPEKKLLFA